ncbi:Hypothetical protein R9X50_00789900 [Acrodontium crateriforme]|uniref:Rgp1 n=1 Tax=Acrodontium crateriforme TaxID=150365 RepID=A0AAQ3R842_9PEZI|nr:Hypothetical protein R9X50_00789900 [Acrodontium crateriforme]
MPAVPALSNIRAFVQWRDAAVYAGEEIECIITFMNTAVPPGQEREPLRRASHANGSLRPDRPTIAPSAAGSRRTSLAQIKSQSASRAPSVISARIPPPPKRGHRPALSLNVVSASPRAGINSAPLHRPKTPNSAARPNRDHGRSLSIMSLNSEAPCEARILSGGGPQKRPGRGHARSASLQYPPTKSSPQMPNSAAFANRQPSPLYESTTPPALEGGADPSLPLRPARQRPAPPSNTNTRPSGRQNHSTGAALPDFSFPASPADDASKPIYPPPKPSKSPSTMHSRQQHRGISPRPPDGWSGALNNLNPISRVMSNSSATGTPRTSSEFYSMSNHSDETLMSDLPQTSAQLGRLLPRSPYQRQASRNIETPVRAEPETLMMGFAHTIGQFTLDGSLVNAAPFEEVKRKGVQGGGGVVGVERSKRSSGMFGAFSWGNIGESLGGLLGSDEMSSIAQMKANAGSKAIPLLSTPQSLLFVDLNLAPGESRSFNYKFTLPRGLPPTHKGRAIKVAYNLTIGVQRPGGNPVKRVEIPFRVLGSYNTRGEVLGHDLMSPYVLLKDAAQTKNIAQETPLMTSLPSFRTREVKTTTQAPKQGIEDFLRYTERLLEQPAEANGVLLSPTISNSPNRSRQHSLVEQNHHSNIKEAIDFAILCSNHVRQRGRAAQSEAQSANRFNISRSGQPVGVLTLVRPAYKLGETVTGVIDFTAPPLNLCQATPTTTYAVLVELESAERIDSSLALRSSHSIHRVTRKVHSTIQENAAFSRQISFNLSIPSHATPSFETTGVSVAWMLRIEFTTRRSAPTTQPIDSPDPAADDGKLLEEVGNDDRGTTLIAREHLMAETFEIAVPLTVYGAPTIESFASKREAIEV